MERTQPKGEPGANAVKETEVGRILLFLRVESRCHVFISICYRIPPSLCLWSVVCHGSGVMLLCQFEGAVISHIGDFLLQITPKTNTHDEILSNTVLSRDFSQLEWQEW